MKSLAPAVLLSVLLVSTTSYAAGGLPQTNADAARVGEDIKKSLLPPPPPPAAEVKHEELKNTAPSDFGNIKIKLVDVKISGMTKYSEEEIKEFYKDDLGKKVPIERVWEIAADITKKYQKDGYFISKAYVPEQQFDKKATVKINVVEGYVGQVEIDGKLENTPIIRRYIEDIKAEKPLNSATLEEIVLRINDLAGLNFRTVINAASDTDANDGEVKLTLIKQDVRPIQSIQINNSGSRFLGPQRASYSFSKSFLPFTQTDFSVLAAMPISELKYFSLANHVDIFPDWKFNFFGSKTITNPGYTLKQNDVRGNSTDYGFSFADQLIRTRDKNLDLDFGFESKDSENFIFRDFLLSKDHIREVSVSANYTDNVLFSGTNSGNLKFVQGLDALGSSSANDIDISRIDAKPDFQKLEFAYSYTHNFIERVGFVASVSGQYSPDSLYSAEEFGFGGQNFGRAYDDSEFLGDSGIDGSLEFRYLTLDTGTPGHFIPYVFVDAGRLWNRNSGQPGTIFASSRGLGFYYIYKTVSFNLVIAQPIAQTISTPAYGHMENYRIVFNTSYNF